MKKAIAIILALLVVGVMFAAEASATLELELEIEAAHLVKLTKALFEGNSVASLTAAESFVGTGTGGALVVSGSGDQTFVAYVSAISNTATGYSLKMSGTALSNGANGATTPTYIDYELGANNKTYTTNGATTVTAVEIASVGAVEIATPLSYQLSLNVDETTYNQAVVGAYAATITFELLAN